MATRGDKYEAAHIAASIMSGEFQLWGAVEDGKLIAVGVTRILNHPKKRVCQIIGGTGDDREKWQYFIAQIEDWARAEGCQETELVARQGWARIFKPLGYVVTHVMASKEL